MEPIPVRHAADESHLVHALGHSRQVLTNVQTGNGGGDRLELASNLGRRCRLEVEGVQMARATVIENEDSVFDLGRKQRRLLLLRDRTGP